MNRAPGNRGGTPVVVVVVVMVVLFNLLGWCSPGFRRKCVPLRPGWSRMVTAPEKDSHSEGMNGLMSLLKRKKKTAKSCSSNSKSRRAKQLSG